MTPTEARAYISTFHLKANCPPIQYVDLSGGSRVYIKDMTDEQAVDVAYMMADMEVEAAERSIKKGVPIQ